MSKTIPVGQGSTDQNPPAQQNADQAAALDQTTEAGRQKPRQSTVDPAVVQSYLTAASRGVMLSS